MASSTVLIFRPSMLSDFKKTTCLDGARLISSQWSGYIRQNDPDLLEMTRMGIERDHVHTSGHATVDELQQFIDGIDADRIVPIHLVDREGFAKLSDRVDFKDDHQWWDV
jgi:ribonuclease J